MLRRALRRAALAVALIAPTLAGVVVQAPLAQASVISGSPFKGAAQVTATYGDTTIAASTWTVPSGTSSCNASDAYTTGDRANWLYTSGSEVWLCFDNKVQATDGVPDFTMYLAELHVRDFNNVGNVIGDRVVASNGGGSGNFENISRNGIWTTTQFFNSGGAPLSAKYELYVDLYVTPNKGCGADIGGGLAYCDSRGAGPPTGSYAQGYVSAYQYLNGVNVDSKTVGDTIETNTCGSGNSCFGTERVFKKTWGNPSGNTDVHDWAAAGKAILWSVKASQTWSGNCSGGPPCSGSSPWAQAAAAQTGATSMQSMIQQLQDDTYPTLSTGPAFNTITIAHEPHDDAIDTTQGWNNGASGHKCGGATDPSVAGGTKNKPCMGTSADYELMYSHLMAQRNTSCNSTGGTSGTLGFPCSHVLIQYIAVPSNMYPQGSLSEAFLTSRDRSRIFQTAW